MTRQTIVLNVFFTICLTTMGVYSTTDNDILKMWKDIYSVPTTSPPDDNACECVPFYLCNFDNFTIISNGAGIIDLKQTTEECEPVNNTQHVCCKLGLIRESESPHTHWEAPPTQWQTQPTQPHTPQWQTPPTHWQSPPTQPHKPHGQTPATQWQTPPTQPHTPQWQTPPTHWQSPPTQPHKPHGQTPATQWQTPPTQPHKPQWPHTQWQTPPTQPHKPQQNPPKNRPGCGYRNDQGVGIDVKAGFETVSRDAGYGEFPWVVALFAPGPYGQLVYNCSGSLIHPQVVMTTANCATQKNVATARAGVWDIKAKEELYSRQDRQIVKKIIHEGFQPASAWNSIALLVLDEPFEITNNVDIVCLPRSYADGSNSERCLAGGWGKDNFDEKGTKRTVLKSVILPMVRNDVCEYQLQKTRLSKYFKLHKSFVCAGGGPDDTCAGDGGSPLICPVEGSNKQYKQVGITSWGIGCKTETPGVYTNVPYFKEWINDKMAELNFKTEYDYNVKIYKK